MTKRGMALLTVTLMLLVAAVPALGADVPYPDVAKDHWAYEAIERLHSAGLIEGYPDGTFGGERTFTRYEMAMVFDRILQRLDGRYAKMLDAGVDPDAVVDEFAAEFAVIDALSVALNNAQRTAAEAKEIAEAAASSADTAGDRAYHARLAAEQALAQSQKANDTAAMALALAGEEGAEGSDLEDVRQAAQRAQRVAADAESAAMRANAVAEMAFAASDESLAETVEETRLAAQRAQRLAADAEAAALKAQAMAEHAMTTEEAEAALSEAEDGADRAYRARLTAEQARALGQQADDKATRALSMSEIAMRDTESVVGIAQEALDTALQADRLAYLAHLSAERALDTAEDAHGRIDDLEHRVATTPRLSGELRADYENAHTSKEGELIDPRGAASGPKTYNESDIEVGVGLRAIVEPKEDVRVEGGINFRRSVFSDEVLDVGLSDLYTQVTTPGALRLAYFGGLTGANVSTGFNKFALDAATYNDNVDDDNGANRGGAIVEAQLGRLNTRLIASKTDTPDELIWGVGSTLALADGMNLGISHLHKDEAATSTAIQVFGASASLDYDWTFAQFKDDMAIDGSLGTDIGDLSVGYTYRSIGDAFQRDGGDYFGKQYTWKDDNIEAGYKDSLLTLGLPLFGLDLEYNKGYEADLDDTEFTDWHKVGFTADDILGFGLSAHYYMDTHEPSPDGAVQAYRVGIDRTVEIGVPLTFSFVHADMELENEQGVENPAGWDKKTHQAFGVAIDEHALADNVTVDAGYKLEQNPLGGDWTNFEKWDVSISDDVQDPWGYVAERSTLHAGAAIELAEGLTLSGGYERVDNDTSNEQVIVATTDVGAEYTFGLYAADVTLGYDLQNVTKTGDGFVYDASPRSTYSVGYVQPAWGGTFDAGYKLVIGRGSDGLEKLEARDTTAHLDYTYPVAEDMEFSFGGKWTNSADNGAGQDDYHFSSVKAGFGLKF